MDWYKTDIVVDDISALGEHIYDADMIINCVLWPKDRKDHLVTRDMLRRLKKGALVVDISCDTAGAIETRRSTMPERCAPRRLTSPAARRIS